MSRHFGQWDAEPEELEAETFEEISQEEIEIAHRASVENAAEYFESQHKEYL